MRVWMRRRSSSIFVSPGPRLPMPVPEPPTWPPAWRDIDSPQPRSRGSRYSSCASSTCALPSRLLACWLKMSRITAVRSMTLTFTTSSSARRWLGASSVSATTVSAPSARRHPPAPAPCRGRGRCSGRDAGAAAAGRRARRAPAVSASAASSRSEFSASSSEPLRVDADQHDVLEPQLPVLDLGDVFELGREPGDAAQGRALFAVELLAVGVRRAPSLVVQRWSRARCRSARSPPIARPRWRARGRASCRRASVV